MADVGKKEIDVKDLKKSLSTMSLEQMKSLSGKFTKFGGDTGFENPEAVKKAFEMAMMSRQNAQASGGGTVVVNNNNNVDNSVKSAAKTNFNAAVATRQNESTVRALQASG